MNTCAPIHAWMRTYPRQSFCLCCRFVWKSSSGPSVDLEKQQPRRLRRQPLVVMRPWHGPWRQRLRTVLCGSRSNLTHVPTPWSMCTRGATGRQSKRSSFLHCQICIRHKVIIIMLFIAKFCSSCICKFNLKILPHMSLLQICKFVPMTTHWLLLCTT